MSATSTFNRIKYEPTTAERNTARDQEVEQLSKLAYEHVNRLTTRAIMTSVNSREGRVPRYGKNRWFDGR